MQDDEEWIDKVEKMILEEMAKDPSGSTENFKAVAHNLTCDALCVLLRMKHDIGIYAPYLLDDYHLLWHYLDYLRRFCQGKV